MEKFRNTLEECQLSDLRYFGPRYTWYNARDDEGFTQERLNRAIANHEWCSIFKEVDVNIMVARSSDHALVMISFDQEGVGKQPSKFRFKFEAKWLEEEEYH